MAALASAPDPKIAAVANLGSRFRQAMGEPAPTKAPDPVVTAPETPKGVPEPKAPEVKAPEVKIDPKQAKTPDQNFKALNAEFDKFRATSESRVKELETQLTEAVKKANGELELTKAESKRYQEIVAQVALERDPRFIAAFDGKINAAIADAKEAVATVNADKVEKLLRLPASESRDAALKELAGELDEFERGALLGAYRDLKRANREREGELAKASENVKNLHELDLQTDLKQKVEKRQFKENVFTDELSKFSLAYPEFKPIEGNEEHNKLVNETVQRAKDWLNIDLTDADLTRMAMFAAMGYSSIQTNAIRDTLIAKLQKQVGAQTHANPSLLGNATETKVPNKPRTVEDIKARFHKARSEGIPQPA